MGALEGGQGWKESEVGVYILLVVFLLVGWGLAVLCSYVAPVPATPPCPIGPIVVRALSC